jgi:hypothetical protein
MEPEDSLPCSQELAIFMYPEPDESSPRPPIIFIEDLLLYYPPI